MSKYTPAYKGRSAAFSAAMSHSAKKRQCPNCGRKSALIRFTYEENPFVAYGCRWCYWGKSREELHGS